MPLYFQRPENALKRANEFSDVGKKQAALDALYDVIKSRKHRTWQKIHEPIVNKYLELCVELKKSHVAKEGLFQYRNICQQVNIKSLEDVVRRYLALAEEKTEAAREESQQVVVDIDDLDQVQTPENLLLSAVSCEDTQDRTDRVVLTPWVKFLWDNGSGRHFKMSLSKRSRTFSLQIENIELWPLDFKKRTPTFSPEPDLKFYAMLQTKSTKYDKTFNLSFHLEQGDATHINHIAVVTDSAGNELLKINPKSHIYQDGARSCELDGCSLDQKSYPVLVFKWTMEFVRFTETEAFQYIPRPASVNMLNLTNDLKEMYSGAQNTDTTLKVGDIDLRVHKCILSKRSPIFAKMFEANTIEYNIPDLQPSVMKDLVQFLYSATINKDNFKSVHDLYHAADVFEVDDLKTTCVSVLLSKLDVGNACQALVLAHYHQDKKFKTSVMRFVLSHLKEIMKTNVWREFVKEQTDLAAEVMEVITKSYWKLIRGH